MGNKYNKVIKIIFVILFIIGEVLFFIKFGFVKSIVNISILCLVLLLEAINDLKYKQIKIDLLIFCTILKIADIALFFDILKLKYFGFAVALFLFILFISKVTKQSIGIGDGLILFVVCSYVGIKYTLLIFVLSLILVSVFGIAKIIMKKATRKDYLPLVPFLYISFIIVLIGGNI